MDSKDKEIKKALESMQSNVLDSTFTEKIVTIHLERQAEKRKVVPIDFTSLISGLILAVVASLLTYINTLIDLQLSSDQIAVIQIVPVIYLLFQLLNEVLSNKNFNKPSGGLISKGLSIILLCVATALFR